MSINTRWWVDANNLERPYYVVMMVRPVSEADSHGVEGAMERVGIDMIYKRAVSCAFDATLDMEKVRLILSDCCPSTGSRHTFATAVSRRPMEHFLARCWLCV